MARGFTLVETVVVAGLAAVGAAVAGPIIGTLSPEAKRVVSLRNMQLIGAAGGAYRADNDGYLPIEGIWGQRRTTPAGTMNAWANLSAGGKNNNGWWATSGTSSLFDVEAADRPLNAYAVPGVEFYAPPPPARLPAGDPSRVTAQAPVFKDPSDTATRQRQWPAATAGISAYDDVGTSYFWNAAWWSQTTLPGGFEAKMREGTRRMARGEGAAPGRFVWFYDQAADTVINHPATTFKLVNGYGDTNKGVLLFIDGHAGYFDVYPGPGPFGKITPEYTVWFE